MLNRTALAALTMAAAISLSSYAWPASSQDQQTSLQVLLNRSIHGRSSRQIPQHVSAFPIDAGLSATRASLLSIATVRDERVLTPPPHAHSRVRSGS